jgi:XTP/dITP diphosphohydrolase
MRIVFATNNQHKLSEIRQILGSRVEVLSLKDIGCNADIPETGSTLEENALQKAQYVYDNYHIDCFADDTGLEVDALAGAPGVYSARYAAMGSASVAAPSPSVAAPSPSIAAPSPSVAVGCAAAVPQPKGHDSEANMARLLRELGENNNRHARFRTVIALIQHGEVHEFEGIVNGEIIRERRGGEGFGYDPIFQPDGYDKTFAELGTDIKNQISHRARATAKLCDFLTKSK